jgi:hypothetical protein
MQLSYYDVYICIICCRMYFYWFVLVSNGFIIHSHNQWNVNIFFNINIQTNAISLGPRQRRRTSWGMNLNRWGSLYVYTSIYRHTNPIYFPMGLFVFHWFCVVQIYMFILCLGDIHIHLDTHICIVNYKVYRSRTRYK